MANQIQTLTFWPELPDSGSALLTVGDAQLTINGSDFGAGSTLAGDIAASRVFASGVSGSGPVSMVDTLTFGGAVGNYDWPVIEADTSNLYLVGNLSGPSITSANTGSSDGNTYWLLQFICGTGAHGFTISDGVSTTSSLLDSSGAGDIEGAINAITSLDGLDSVSVSEIVAGSTGQLVTFLITDSALSSPPSLSVNDVGSSAGFALGPMTGSPAVQVLTMGQGTYGYANRGSFSIGSGPSYTIALTGTPGSQVCSAASVQSALDAAYGSGATTVYGPDNGPFTLVWNAAGSQSTIAPVSSIDLGWAVTITAAITQHGSALTVPAAADVRRGVAVGSTTGTCYVPAASDVRQGTSVDNTTGTLAIPSRSRQFLGC